MNDDFETAFADFEMAIRLDPRDATVFVRRAGLYIDLDLLDLAMSDYDEALRLDPRNGEALRLRGYAP